jgi:hypothetical protein
MFIFIIIYRSRKPQQFRKKELITLLENLKLYLSKNNIIEYKIIISEQNNDDLFNRGILYNIAFLESEKLFENKKIYIMINCDYLFNINKPFPKDFLLSKTGFVDIYKIIITSEHIPFLGGCFSVDSKSYINSNGFANDIYGWGGEDVGILLRIKERNIPHNEDILNSGIIIDTSGRITANEITTPDSDNYIYNGRNIIKAIHDPINNNGLDNCIYNVDGYGEFQDENIIHFLFSFDYKNK